MRRIIGSVLCAIGIVGSFSVMAQSENLVMNPSFEYYEKCPKTYTIQDQSHKFIQDWTYPTYATPDYFNRCSESRDLGVGVPRNFAGYSEPHSGDGYAGLILSGTDDGYREYIQGTLMRQLEEGKKYCVTYYYKLATYSKFSVDQLSVYLSQLKVENALMDNIKSEPQINNKEGLFLDNNREWEQFCTVYTASGGERYFTIGNFRSYENTNYVAVNKNIKNRRNKEYAYYFIDDVSIKEIDDCTDCECVRHDFETRLVDESLSVGMFESELQQITTSGNVSLSMIGGTAPYQVSWSNGSVSHSLSGLKDGVYEYTAYDAFNCRSEGKLVVQNAEEMKENTELGLENIKEGESIILKNIFFEYDKTKLLPSSFPELNKVVDFMEKNNISLIEISGHTDSDGSDTYNEVLSKGRAESVVKYLQKNGIALSRMKAVGYGESKPIDTNFSDQGKAQNRRVEFTLLKK